MRRLSTLAAAATAVLALAGCTGSTDTSSGDDTSKYEQTWSKTYSDTSCAEWNDSMDDQQQFAAAADMLTSARNKGDGGEGLPDDALIEEFQGGVTTACVNDTQTLAETGAALYLTERDRFRP